LGYFCYFFPGKINLAFQTTTEALRIAEQSGDIMSQAYAYSSHGIIWFARGLLKEAEKHLLKGSQFFEKLNEKGWNSITHLYLGEIYFEMGDFARSKDYYEKGSLLLGHTHLFTDWLEMGAARSRVMNNQKDIDLESLYALARNNKIKAGESWISNYIGEILLNIDDQPRPEAEHWIQKAIETDQRNGVKVHLGKGYALYAEWFKRKGDRLKARESLGRAIEILKECGADGWVEKYEKELGTLS
jgi:tetratricopeptide (TPR) repeat protein